MKTNLIKMTVALSVFALVSCNNAGIKQETIESLKTDNSFYEMELQEKMPAKNNLITEIESHYVEFINKMNPKKKTAFEKDKNAQLKISDQKAFMFELADRIQANNDSLNDAIQGNFQFIESLSNTELTEEQVSIKWMERKNYINKIQLNSEEISNQVINEKLQTRELYNNILTKYGFPEKVVKQIKKK